jgi:hypothetical protein
MCERHFGLRIPICLDPASAGSSPIKKTDPLPTNWVRFRDTKWDVFGPFAPREYELRTAVFPLQHALLKGITF